MIEIILLILAVPVGYLISNMAKDELKSGKKWFRILIIASILGAIGFYLYGNKTIAFTMIFIFIVGFISFIRG